MKVTVIGCGAYGMALANILSTNKNEVTMWTKFESEKLQLSQTRKNEKLIPNFKLSKTIKYTTSMEESLKNSELIVFAIPILFAQATIQEMKKYYTNQHIVIATKGISKTGEFVNEIIDNNINTNKISAISGPSFAVDIVSGNPIGLTLATTNEHTNEVVKKAFSNKTTKIEESKDIYGVEMCGAIKNVFAIASGILTGLGANESTKAMFLTEVVKELSVIIKHFKGNDNTVLSYAGFGDLLLTCTTPKSRNYSLGKMYGEKKPKEQIDAYLETTTVEGYQTLLVVNELFKKHNLKEELLDIIYNIVIKGNNPEQLLTTIVEKRR